MQVFLPPEGLTNLGEASPSQDNIFCAQLQRFQIKNMNERGLHSWHAENCYKKFPFLCKRRACTPGTPSAQLRAWTWIVDCCSFSRFPRRANVRGHQGQRGERGLLLHAEGRRPVSELHVSRRRAGDVRGGAVRAAAGLPALPQGPQGVLQVHLPRPRYPAADTGSTPRLLAFFLSFFILSKPVWFSSVAADGNSLFDSMASGMRLIVSCISSFLILSLLLFMVHRLRQRRRERIETLIGGNCESEFFCTRLIFLQNKQSQKPPRENKSRLQ